MSGTADAHAGDGGRPLAGVKVVDFTRQMAGPYATVMLADHGAHVIKVESLPHGDPSRRTGVDFFGDESALYLMWNRGKRSVGVDLRRAEGLTIAHRLVAGADVVMENFRPGVADRIGIGYEQLLEVNPTLVYCSISGFGPTGPLASHPATDPVVQAMAGVMSVTGLPDGEPLLAGIPVADFSGALFAVQGVLLALLARDRSSQPQKVDVSLLASLMAGLTTRLATFWATGENPARFGNSHSVVVPYQAFPTADGHAMAGIWGEGDWARFCRAIDRPELVQDPRFDSNRARMQNRIELVAELEAVFRTRTTAEWAERFYEAGALFGPVLSFSELFEHPQVRETGIVRQVDHATLGPIPQLAPSVRLSSEPAPESVPPPTLGQHTVEVLKEIGLSGDEISRLQADGVLSAGATTPSELPTLSEASP